MSKADAETLEPLGSAGQGIPTKLEHVVFVKPPPTDSGHENLNAGGHLAERSRPRKLHNRGQQNCTPSR
jgi:hypothetical protein